jgi:hypothetical protein
MSRSLVKITLLMSMFVVVVFTVIVINQSVQVIQLARGVHPRGWAMLCFGGWYSFTRRFC